MKHFQMRVLFIMSLNGGGNRVDLFRLSLKLLCVFFIAVNHRRIKKEIDNKEYGSAVQTGLLVILWIFILMD